MDKSFDFVKLLNNHQKLYKQKPASDVSSGIQQRVKNITKHRKCNRISGFDSIRNLHSNEVTMTDPLTEKQKKIEHRRLQLEKWKEEKEKKKKDAASQKRKPFIIGISHPSLKYVSPPPPPTPMPSKSGRVTRSQTRANTAISTNVAKPSKPKTEQSFAPKNATFNPVLKITKNLPNIMAKTESKKTNVTSKLINTQSSQKSKVTDSSNKTQDRKKTPGKSIKANMGASKFEVPKSESSSEERLRSPKSNVSVKNLANSPMTPKQISTEVKNISPCVTLSRGKDKARKETMGKMAEGLLDEDNSNAENVVYFRRQLDSEVMRITEMCDTWEKISQHLPLPDAIQELVLGAVGQARLLVSQKLAQFGSLVYACARPVPGAALVTPADLHGFWDMVFMQIENVDMRFKKLEDIRARNWVEEVPVLQKKRIQKLVKSSVKPAATSRLRDLIAAARKAKKEQQEPATAGVELHKDSDADSKTFDAGFFCVSSPVKSPATPPVATATPTSTSNRRSLFKAALSGEAKMASANSSSMAMMRASIIGRSIETESVDEPQHETGAMTPVTVSRTPARSILKSADKARTSTRKKSSKKSIKFVLFNSSCSETQNSEEDSVLITNGATTEDAEGDRNKENEKPIAKLQLQNAVDERSPVMTRSRRKSLGTLLDMSIRTLEEQLTTRKDTEEVKSNPTLRRSRRKSKSCTVEESF